MADIINLDDRQLDQLISGLAAAFEKAMTAAASTPGTAASTAVTGARKQLEIEEQRRNIIEQNLQNLTKMEDIQSKINEEASERLKERIDFSEDELDINQKKSILVEEALRIQKEYYIVAKQIEGVDKETVKSLRKQVAELLRIQRVKRQEETEEEERERKRRQVEQEAKRERDIATRDLKYQAESILRNFAGIDNGLLQTAKNFKTLRNEGGVIRGTLGSMAEKIEEAGVRNIALVKGFEKIKELTTFITDQTLKGVAPAFDYLGNIEKAIAIQDEFRKVARATNVLTGEGIDKLSAKFIKLSRETRGTKEEFIAIRTELFTTSRFFRELEASVDGSGDVLQKTAFLLQRRFNVSISSTAKLTDILAQSFGKTVPEIADFQKSLTVTASTLGLNVATIVDDLSNNIDNLARFGLPDIQREFLSLSVIAQKTGLSIQGMTGTLEKFSTFEGALTAASKLNAVFGTTIDGMEIMDEFNLNGPVAALIKLKEGLDQTGRSIDDMNFAELRVFEQTLGFSATNMKALGKISVQELQKIKAETQGLSPKEIDEVLKKGMKSAELTTEAQKKLSDEATNNVNERGKQLDDFNRSALSAAEDLTKEMGELAQAVTFVGSVIGTALIAKMAMFIGKIAIASKEMGIMAAISQTMGMGPMLPGAQYPRPIGPMPAPGPLGRFGAGAMGLLTNPLVLATVGGIAAGTMIEGGDYDLSDSLGIGNQEGEIKKRGGIPGFQTSATSISGTDGEEKIVKVSEMNTPELISLREQAISVPPNTAINPLSIGGPSSVNLTINLMAKDGSIVETTTVNRSLNKEQMDAAITTFLDTNLSLSKTS